MFSIMGNCMSWVKNRRVPNRKLTLGMFGLDNAGKTVTTKGLQGEPLESVAPTIGFSTVEFRFDKNDITLYDLGGGKRIRDIWKNYFGEIYGLIFVVDSTDPDRMDECRQVLTNLLEDPRITGKPMLLLANKQDLEGAMDELDICQHLNLEELVNINKCPCRVSDSQELESENDWDRCPCKVETCSAILGQGKKMDKSIKNGLKWLLNTISLQWEKLSIRVEKDVAEQREREKREQKKRQEMVRKKREERERKEKEERRLRGEPETDEEEDPSDFQNGGPFKTVDPEELGRKQAALKAEKARKKQEEQARKSAQLDSDSDEKPAPKSSRSHSKSLGDRQKIIHSDDSDEGPGFRQTRRRRTQSHRSRTPSPENTPRLNRRKLGAPGAKSSHSDEEVETSFASRSPWLKKRSPRPLDALPALSHRSPRGILDDDELDMPAPNRGRSLMPIGHLEPLETVDGRRKKKKKKLRRNQVAATEDDDIKSDTASITSNEIISSSQPRGWGTPPGQRSMLKASKSPRLESQLEEQEPETDSFAQRWGLAEDLPPMADNVSLRRHRPNMDSGDDIIT